MRLWLLLNTKKHLLLLITFQICLIAFFTIKANYSWQHIEMTRFQTVAINNYTSLSPKAILGYFSTMGALETESRSRAINMLLLGLNTHLRVFLFDIGILHPSLSISWILSFLFAPYMLYLLTLRLFKSSWIAVASTLLFSVSIGNLSTVLMLFHPGKPLVTVLFLAVLLIVYDSIKEFKLRYYFYMFICVFIGGNADETFYILAPLIFLIYPDLISNFKKHLKLNLTLILSFAFNLFFLTFIYSKLGQLVNTPTTFNFWEYAISSNTDLAAFNPAWIWTNFVRIINRHFDFATLNTADDFDRVVGPVLIFFIINILILYFKKNNRLQTLKWLGVLIFFTVLQTLILTRRGGILANGPFYWGVLSSPLLCLYFGYILSLFTDLKNIAAQFVKILLTSALIVLLFYNSLDMSDRVKKGMISKAGFGANVCWDFNKEMVTVDDSVLKNIWSTRRLDESVVAASKLPRQYYWFQNELELWRYKNSFATKIDFCL